ncbi:DsbE family thiol:disulfide interchange protein [Kaistia defluvii]|uniref:DsbE family thiol:disulfide interchange protein n=1 Tax=Kaistia defluvii TaxID=410841 RepID=UPI00225624DE|nr:DsbE family thiol:disulfide interchange protein [Kaistia defluvii]MCX5521282.1 DsbE family thiol:disulfide interchange protein [Kaistia defluvii]
MTATEAKPARSLGRRLAIAAPIAAFAALAVIFVIRLEQGGDPSLIPSALIGRAAPATVLPPLEGLDRPGIDTAELAGKVTLVNIWASWCVPCREEHPILEKLAADGRINLVGINYKDKPANARGFLGQMGNPYAAVGVDEKGRSSIDWGVYGVPETFLVGRDGKIRFKFVGPLSEESLSSVLMPEIEKALAAS